VGWQEDLAKIGCRVDRKIIEIINIKKKEKKVYYFQFLIIKSLSYAKPTSEFQIYLAF
jgi:hypothetical protein